MSRSLPVQYYISGVSFRNVIKFCELGKKYFPLSKTILNLNHAVQIKNKALLCLNCHMIRSVPASFVAPFKTAYDTAITPGQVTASISDL
jgi:hypothetical protein